MPSPMIVENEEVSPPDGDFWTKPDTLDSLGRPKFGRRAVAEVFFGRSYIWLFKILNDRPLSFDGKPYVPDKELRRNASSGYFELTLYDIEKLAHTFAESAIISVDQLERTILLVKTIGQNYKLL